MDQSQICSLLSQMSEQRLQVDHDSPIQEHLAHTLPKARRNRVQQCHSLLQQHQPQASLQIFQQSHQRFIVRSYIKQKIIIGQYVPNKIEASFLVTICHRGGQGKKNRKKKNNK